MTNANNNLGETLRLRRAMIPLTLKELSSVAHVSPSHLARIERGQRFPSARVLHKIVKPLGFCEYELLVLAEYLSPPKSNTGESEAQQGQLDTYVALVLSQEPIEVQRAVVAVLSALKYMAKAISL